MEFRIMHVYPDLMSLYGSYANVSVLTRYLKELGHTVTVEYLHPRAASFSLDGVDFLFMGAGTELAQKVALADLRPYGEAVRAAAEDGVSMLFAGTAMELLGKTITDADGTAYTGLELGSFTAVQSRKRIVGDVYGTTDLCSEPVVGFMNKCSLVHGVETPLLTSCAMGFGNETEGGAEGFRFRNVLASELTGPILVKNPRLLDAVAAAILQRRGAPLPQERPVFPYAEAGYTITARQLKLRCEQQKS